MVSSPLCVSPAAVRTPIAMPLASANSRSACSQQQGQPIRSREFPAMHEGVGSAKGDEASSSPTDILSNPEVCFQHFLQLSLSAGLGYRCRIVIAAQGQCFTRQHFQARFWSLRELPQISVAKRTERERPMSWSHMRQLQFTGSPLSALLQFYLRLFCPACRQYL